MLRAAPNRLQTPKLRDVEMIETAAPSATGSAAWAETLLLSFAQAGYVRAEPAILQPVEPFLDLSGEDIRNSLYLTTDATGENSACGPTSRFRSRATTSPPAAASLPGSATSARCSVIAASARGIPAGRHRFLRPPRPRRRRRRDARARPRGRRNLRPERRRYPDRRRRTVQRAARRARPVSGLAAAADQGFQPQDQPGAGHRASHGGDRPGAQ